MWVYTENRSPVFCVNTLLACPVRPNNNFTMTIQKPAELDNDNILKVTDEVIKISVIMVSI
jgi:hypothetical protein